MCHPTFTYTTGNVYVLFDLPGQVELFTLQQSIICVVKHLTTTLAMRLTCVHCVDAHLCSDAPKYLAALLLSLNVMLHLELPHVNVLTKVRNGIANWDVTITTGDARWT